MPGRPSVCCSQISTPGRPPYGSLLVLDYSVQAPLGGAARPFSADFTPERPRRGVGRDFMLMYQNELFKNGSRDFWDIFLLLHFILHLERLGEALGGYLGCWEALPLLLGSSSFFNGDFAPFGLRKKMGHKLEMEMRRGGANGAWSSCQEPWERLCIFSLVPISSLSLQFVEP